MRVDDGVAFNLRHLPLFILFVVRGWKLGSELHALDRGSTAQPIGRLCRTINSIHGLLGGGLTSVSWKT